MRRRHPGWASRKPVREHALTHRKSAEMFHATHACNADRQLQVMIADRRCSVCRHAAIAACARAALLVQVDAWSPNRVLMSYLACRIG
jgi:hypothetical protein